VKGTASASACATAPSPDTDVLRREQEHLAGDALDPSVQSERQAAGEVDETARVGVAHLRQVDDDRDAVAEVLGDRLRIPVLLRVDGQDFADGRGRGLTDHGGTVERCHGSGLFDGGGLVPIRRLRSRLLVDLFFVGQTQVHHGLLERVRHRILRCAHLF